MFFKYRVKNELGNDKYGEIEALDGIEAVKNLQEQGLYVISLKVVNNSLFSRLKKKLFLAKGLLSLVNCFKCKKEIERFSIKKIEDNKFICDSCFKAIKADNKKIIFEIIEKYLSNKDGNFYQSIRVIYNSMFNISLEPDSLDKAKDFFSANLSNLKMRKLTKDIDEIIYNKNLYENSLDFLVDLEKIQKLLKNKDIEIYYPTILAMFIEFIDVENNKTLENVAITVHKSMIESFGGNVSKEMVIALLIESGWRFESAFRLGALYKILDKLNLSFTKEEIENLIKETKERIELKEFEQSLGSQKKADIGDSKDLDGHEFEGYVQKLFEFLGYTVVRTPLTGDQGADLIISKDGMKTVVQAKKYEGSVSNKAIQEVVAAKNYYKAEKMMVVTNSSFTKGAIDLALSNNVELWDGEKLQNIVNNLEAKKEQVYEQTIAWRLGEDKKTTTVTCPLCKKEFGYEINLKELKDSEIKETINFKLLCPHCGVDIKAETQTTRIISWSCQYCYQEFDTKEEAERHEKECKSKGIANPND